MLDDDVAVQLEPLLLVAVKEFGIHHLALRHSRVPIQSLEQICRDNTHLKILEICCVTFFDEESTISVSPQQDEPQDSSVFLALDLLTMDCVIFADPTVATKFSNFIAHVTCQTLELGGMCIGDYYVDEAEKITRMRVVSELIKQTLQQLTLQNNFPIEAVDAVEACSTIMQIQLDNMPVRFGFCRAESEPKLQSIATRNRALARFVSNPRAYPGDELLALMRQSDNCPTGRYMLARCLPGIPSFFQDQGH